MKYVTIDSFCEAVAESIRKKEGSTEKINPQDFADRINGLEVGSASSKMRYFKVVNPLPSAGGGDKAIYAQMSQLTRCEDNGKVFINSGYYDTQIRGKKAIAYGVDLSIRLVDTRSSGATIKTLEESLVGMYDDPAYFEEITEEQFYDLNTLLTPQEITFSVAAVGDATSAVEYTAVAGMTWEEFCYSNYNSGGDWGSNTLYFEAAGDLIDLSSGGIGYGTLKYGNGTIVKPADVIISGETYFSGY